MRPLNGAPRPQEVLGRASESPVTGSKRAREEDPAQADTPETKDRRPAKRANKVRSMGARVLDPDPSVYARARGRSFAGRGMTPRRKTSKPAGC